MQNIRELHRRAVEAIRPVLTRVRPADLDRPTPCAGWDLRTLLAHMTGQDRGFAAAALADVSAEAFAPADPETWAAGAAVVVAAFAAADPARSVLLPEFGDRRFPLDTVIGFHLLDTLVHGWDVAATLGTPTDYDDELLTAVRQQAERVPGGAARTAPGAAFAPALPTAADGWAGTLALLGRDPNWH
ncbi:TIGR03086 family metal-binding protein [Actinophytocola sp.]|uniref:TIGR03086 family metal-binding protein n=1 Tax=Actinophytocola sp. TaxID=1872138 RepID=UPI00389A5884